MKKLVEHVSKLKLLTAGRGQESDLNPFVYFMMNVGSKNEYFKYFKRIHYHKVLFQVLGNLAQDVFEEETPINILILFQNQKIQFSHGVVYWDNGCCWIVYFHEDLNMGMVQIHVSERVHFTIIPKSNETCEVKWPRFISNISNCIH